MIVIGILAPEHGMGIIGILKKIVSDKGGKMTAVKASEAKYEYLYQLEKLGTELFVVDINERIKENIFFDVLLYDNAAGKITEEYEIDKNMMSYTKLIYNMDFDKKYVMGEYDSLSYGLTGRAMVTISSVTQEDTGMKIMCCIQKFKGKESVQVHEKAVYTEKSGENISHILAAAAIMTAAEIQFKLFGLK